MVAITEGNPAETVVSLVDAVVGPADSALEPTSEEHQKGSDKKKPRGPGTLDVAHLDMLLETVEFNEQNLDELRTAINEERIPTDRMDQVLDKLEQIEEKNFKAIMDLLEQITKGGGLDNSLEHWSKQAPHLSPEASLLLDECVALAAESVENNVALFTLLLPQLRPELRASFEAAHNSYLAELRNEVQLENNRASKAVEPGQEATLNPSLQATPTPRPSVQQEFREAMTQAIIAAGSDLVALRTLVAQLQQACRDMPSPRSAQMEQVLTRAEVPLAIAGMTPRPLPASPAVQQARIQALANNPNLASGPQGIEMTQQRNLTNPAVNPVQQNANKTSPTPFNISTPTPTKPTQS